MTMTFPPDRADEAASLGTRGGGITPARSPVVLGVPGAARIPSAEEQQVRTERTERAARIAAIERQLTAKRLDVQQLQLVIADPDCAGRESYRPRLKQAEADLHALEDQITQLN